MFAKKIRIMFFVLCFAALSAHLSAGPLASVYKRAKEAGHPFPKAFDDDEVGYFIRYPADWTYERPGKYQVVFSGRHGTKAYDSMVAIQNLASVKQGGVHDTIESVKRGFIRQLKKPAEGVNIEVKITGEKPFSYSGAEGPALRGNQFTAEFTNEKGEAIKQWVVVIERVGKEVFYVWSYTSPAAQFDDHLGIAQQMLDSLEVK